MLRDPAPGLLKMKETHGSTSRNRSWIEWTGSQDLLLMFHVFHVVKDKNANCPSAIRHGNGKMMKNVGRQLGDMPLQSECLPRTQNVFIHDVNPTRICWNKIRFGNHPGLSCCVIRASWYVIVYSIIRLCDCICIFAQKNVKKTMYMCFCIWGHDDQPCDAMFGYPMISQIHIRSYDIIRICMCIYIYVCVIYIYIIYIQLYTHTYVVALVARLKKTHLENQSRSKRP